MARGADAEGEREGSGPGPTPRANPDLVGHEAAERELEARYRTGRLPHAILLGGPYGIGKATLAFRFARFVLAQTDGPEGGERSDRSDAAGLGIGPESGVFRRVAAGGHADLMTVERAWDARRKRWRGEIVVDDVREILGFFRLTAAEEGWRIVIIDGAEAMNRNAANAVLKILEEPPERALLLLVSHNPGRLLPTIRSRCRQLRLAALTQAATAQLIRQYRPGLDAAEAEGLAALCNGSIGRALGLADGGGLALYRALLELLAQVPRIDPGRLHGLADQLARTDAEDAYRATTELLLQLLSRLATGAGSSGDGGGRRETVAGENAILGALTGAARPARWAALWTKTAEDLAAAQELNLDRKQALLGAFFAIEEVAR